MKINDDGTSHLCACDYIGPLGQPLPETRVSASYFLYVCQLVAISLQSALHQLPLKVPVNSFVLYSVDSRLNYRFIFMFLVNYFSYRGQEFICKHITVKY
jgi:hypothetical protein